MLCVRTAVQALLAVRLALAGIPCFALCPVNLFTVNFNEPDLQQMGFQADAGFAFTVAFAVDKVSAYRSPRRNWISTLRFLLAGVDTAAHQFLRFLAADAAVEPGVLPRCWLRPVVRQCRNTGTGSPFRGHFPDPVEVAQTAGVQVEVVGIVHGGISVLKGAEAPCAGCPASGLAHGLKALRVTGSTGIPRCAPSAFQECMADFGDNGITATAFGVRGQRDLLPVAE